MLITPPTINPNCGEKGELYILNRFHPIGPLPFIFPFPFLYLSLTGAGKWEILKMGIGFTGVVFATHLLAGPGFILFLHRLLFTPAHAKTPFAITAGFVLPIGLQSLYDVILQKRGKEEKRKRSNSSSPYP